MKKRSLIVLLHLLYWYQIPIYLFFYAGKQPVVTSDYNRLLILTPLAAGIIIFYWFYFFLFPRYILSGRILKFSVYSIFSIAFMSFWCYGVLKWAASTLYFGYPDTTYNSYVWNILIRVTVYSLSGCLLKGFVNWYAERAYRRELEKKNLQTELALLKAQINPHFLFNTLNNIDVLIEKDAKAASVYLKKLSGILRFMLYENSEDNIALAKEVEYVKEYIELQKIRTTNPSFIKFEVRGGMDNIFVAPMLFIPFIENAFKHSTNKKINNAVEITVCVNADKIKFTCINAYDEENVLTQTHSGLGLELIKNRLNLLYKQHHQLIINKTDEQFIVALTIDVHDN